MTTITIGLDGANWEMIEPWLDAGDLPNLQRLIDAGVGGVSESCLPPLTVPNWKCYSTGKNPGKLDVFRFDRIDVSAREHHFHDSQDFKSAELWDYLNQAGHSAGVINKPSTYPPKELDGFVVAGGPDASETEYRSLQSGFATPKSVERYLGEELDYRVHPSPMLSPSDTGPAEVEAVLDLIDLRFETAARLLERESPSFLHLTVFYSMGLQHYFWRDEPVKRAWKRIDDQLGRFVDEGHDLLVMSDHGTWHVDRVFYINAWLAEHGYLATKGSVDDWLRRAGFTRERALWLAKRLGVVETLSQVVPDEIQKRIPWSEGVKRDRLLSLVDWDRTTAVASNMGPLYLNAEGAARDRLRDELVDRLSGLEHPKTGHALVDEVHVGEELYEGPYADNAPDLVIESGPNVYTSDALGPDEWYGDSGVWVGGNMPDGIFLFNGPSFRDDGLGEQARIVDLAPTLLHSMGVPVPNDVDGRVLDVFAPGTEPAERSIEYQSPIAWDGRQAESPAKNEEVEQRLADLGYME